ncbi:HNH endonuclease [compost metagenome]
MKQVKDLLSHVLPDGNWKDLFVHLAKKEIKAALGKDSAKLDLTESKKEIVEIASINREKKDSTQSFLVTRQRRPVKITTKRILLKKADHCCEFVNEKTGVRCRSHYQLQIDHKVPLAKNGSNDVSNLRVLCRTHNLLAARQWGVSDY